MTRARLPFLALVLAQTFSLSGTRLSMIAIPWLVLTTTGDAVLTGIVAFAEMLPYVLVKALGGPFIDRLGARVIAIAGDLGALVAVGAVPVLHWLGILEMATLIPLVVLMGALRGPADAAKQAMVPAVAETGDLPLERVTGVLGTIERLASTIGAAAAGALVAALGPAPALTLNAATFGLSALAVAIGIARTPRPVTAAAPTSYGQELSEGWTFLRKDAVLVGIVVMVGVTNLIDQANATVLMPVWAQESGHGAAILGLLFAIFSGFSVLGSLLATGFAERLPRLTVYAVAFLITGAPRYCAFAFDAPLPGIIAILATGGLASGFLNPILSAVILERIPKPLIGRVYSLVNALTWSLMPFGGLVAGALIAGTSLPTAFILAGLVYLAATMLPLTLKSFRAFAHRPVDHVA